MERIPGHLSPSYTKSSCEDALFHYTSADGLAGIFKSGEIWSTAYYCANDESELGAGKGVLTPFFREEARRLIAESDSRIGVLRERGVDVLDVAENFENMIISLALNLMCAYITCFCKPRGEEDFRHGLLSQWRGYGDDGGYALQFSRNKLESVINTLNRGNKLNYNLRDVFYTPENALKGKMASHKEAFVDSYLSHLSEISRPLRELLSRNEMPSPIRGLLGGPLESLLDYLVLTKNVHFNEEHECRLSLIQLVHPMDTGLQAEYFNRNGLLVPYIKSPVSDVNILDCIEWIVIGPGPRMESRMKSVSQMIMQSGRDIKVRLSHIPFTRL